MEEEKKPADDTQLQPARPAVPDLSSMEPAKSIAKPDSGIGLTEGMDRIQAAATGKKYETPRGLSMRTRMALRYVAPYWNRMTRWANFSIIVIILALDLNARFGGFIGNGVEWVRTSILSTYPSIAFIAGMFVHWRLAVMARNKE